MFSRQKGGKFAGGEIQGIAIQVNITLVRYTTYFQASNSFTTSCSSTPVSLKSRPRKLNVSLR